MAERLTWLATHTHSSSPSYTHTQGGEALAGLTMHSPTLSPQRERRAISGSASPQKVRGKCLPPLVSPTAASTLNELFAP